MNERNIVEDIVRPDMPYVVPNEVLHVYVPKATYGTPGIVSFNEDYFTINTDGNVSINEDVLPTEVNVVQSLGTSATDVISQNVVSKIINSSKNLIGSEVGVFYPVILPVGTNLTLSTSDGSTTTREDAIYLDFYDITKKTRVSYWLTNSQPTPVNSRLIRLDADAYYAKWRKQPPVPFQLELGTTATEYEPYKGWHFTNGVYEDIENRFSEVKVYAEWISGEYVKADSGAIVKDSTMKRTDYIDISNNRDGVLIEGTTLRYKNYWWWYTESKEPLQAVSGIGLGKTFIPPTNAKYLIISCDVNDDVKVVTTSTYSFSEIEKSINEKLDKNQGASNAGKMLIVGEDGSIVCSENAGSQSSLINKEVENGLNQALRGSNTGTGNSKVLSLSVFTDIHADAENLARYITFCNHYKSKISDKLCLGDMVANQYSDDFTYWTNMSGSSDILRAIGNHDARLAGTTNGGNVPRLDAYNKFFAGNIANWGVTQPNSASANGLMYYYKDYTEQNVRLIVLDCMYYDDAENAWFASVLTDAKEKGLHVVCASHYHPSKARERIDNCNFYPTQYGNSYIVSFDLRASTNVDTFIGDGGKFVAWMCGDLHWDYFGVINGTNGKQLVLSFECAAAQNSRWYDSNRIKGTISQDSINFVAIDTYANLIKVVRVGNKYDMYLKEKEYFCYDYQSHTLFA